MPGPDRGRDVRAAAPRVEQFVERGSRPVAQDRAIAHAKQRRVRQRLPPNLTSPYGVSTWEHLAKMPGGCAVPDRPIREPELAQFLSRDDHPALPCRALESLVAVAVSGVHAGTSCGVGWSAAGFRPLTTP